MHPELNWMKEAKKWLGHRERGTSNRSAVIDSWFTELGASWLIGQPWCGAFTAHCLKSSGVKIPKHWYRAKDYLNYGTKLSKPAYGCVAVKDRVGGGHVCFVAGRDKRTGGLVCLGGNQGNAVSYALYNESDFVFLWYGTQPVPAPHRYNLPILTNVTSTGVSEQ